MTISELRTFFGVLFVFLFPLSLSAQDINEWTACTTAGGVTHKDWHDNHWSLGGEPFSIDSVIIKGDHCSGNNIPVDARVIDNWQAEAGDILIHQDRELLVSGNLFVEENVFASVTGTIRVGSDTSQTSGTLLFDGSANGSIASTDNFIVGDEGTGTVTQRTADVTVTNNLIVCNQADRGASRYELSSTLPLGLGSLTVLGDTRLGVNGGWPNDNDDDDCVLELVDSGVNDALLVLTGNTHIEERGKLIIGNGLVGIDGGDLTSHPLGELHLTGGNIRVSGGGTLTIEGPFFDGTSVLITEGEVGSQSTRLDLRGGYNAANPYDSLTIIGNPKAGGFANTAEIVTMDSDTSCGQELYGVSSISLGFLIPDANKRLLEFSLVQGNQDPNTALYTDTLAIHSGARVNLNGGTLCYRNGTADYKQFLAADINLDGSVDSSDELILCGNLDAAGLFDFSSGDLDGDLDVDVDDKTIMETFLPNTCTFGVGAIIVNDLPDPPDLVTKGEAPTTWLEQKSDIREIRVTFIGDPVDVTPADIVLTNLGVDAPASPIDVVFNLEDRHVDLTGNVLTLSFDSYELDDGVYSLELLDTIVDGNGDALDGDGDGVPGGTFLYEGNSQNLFYKLAANWNGDSGVSIFDFSTFSYWFGSSVVDGTAPSYADPSVDGGVSIFDFSAFSGNFGKGVVFPTP